ncbi:DUF2103 domain-containing protein [Vulcanococcus sp.]|jgi:hypothetical protein|uniref:DUF2103 domain-containing protein n=1 Tax=Vulcanococcus sp. TaxID=2856995 RepID=UPI0037D9EFA8
MGRLVITHSTYLEGLIPLLKRLVQDPAIDTITPAVIARVRGRAPELRLRVSTPISGGWKLVARRGSSAQEVFVVTTLPAPELEQRIARLVAGDRNR